MRENDFNYIKEVTEFFNSTRSEDNPKGNISAVTEKFSISRTKATKILITSGAIDTPLHRQVMKLKGEGYDVEEIALALEISEATVKTNMPYEKVVYNGDSKSLGAEYIEKLRQKEKDFRKNVLKRPTELEFLEDNYPDILASLRSRQDDEGEDDTTHLEPHFSSEEYEMFKTGPEVALLHIELFEEVPEEDRELCGIKYGKSISRDILAPLDMPLHNLHYAINQAFGFTNSHLHEYEMFDHDFKRIIGDDVESWKKLVGLVFKNPLRDENLDFWDDDYEGGSPKKWMRSKYTGPEYKMCREESYRAVRKKTEGTELAATSMDGVRMGFDLNPFAINEVLQLYNTFNRDPDYVRTKEDYFSSIDNSIEESEFYEDDGLGAQPWVEGFAHSIYYTYDFGDNWKFTISIRPDIGYLLKNRRVTKKTVRAAIKKVCMIARPLILAADGYQLVEDCGGLCGYIEMLRAIENGDEEMKNWANGMGWQKKIDKNAL